VVKRRGVGADWTQWKVVVRLVEVLHLTGILVWRQQHGKVK